MLARMDKPEGTPFNDMRPARKALFVFKLIVCILTFGMAFPNVMSSD
jgi:hypothetical protein